VPGMLKHSRIDAGRRAFARLRAARRGDILVSQASPYAFMPLCWR